MTAETDDDDLLDDLFTGCAALAFVEQARQQQNWPDREATRRRAYRHYEDALAEKNAWAKPDARLICGDGREEMEAGQQPEEGEG